MNAIVYRVDEKGERIPEAPNWCGELENQDGALWLKVKDINGKTIYLSRGDIIHYSHNDIDINQGNYVVIGGEMGIYKVEKY